jgi:ABC-type transporter MlaC component
MKKLIAICLVSIFAFALPMSAMATDLAAAQVEKGMDDEKSEAKDSDADTKDASAQDGDGAEKPTADKADKEEGK